MRGRMKSTKCICHSNGFESLQGLEEYSFGKFNHQECKQWVSNGIGENGKTTFKCVKRQCDVYVYCVRVFRSISIWCFHIFFWIACLHFRLILILIDAHIFVMIFFSNQVGSLAQVGMQFVFRFAYIYLSSRIGGSKEQRNSVFNIIFFFFFCHSSTLHFLSGKWYLPSGAVLFKLHRIFICRRHRRRTYIYFRSILLLFFFILNKQPSVRFSRYTFFVLRIIEIPKMNNKGKTTLPFWLRLNCSQVQTETKQNETKRTAEKKNENIFYFPCCVVSIVRWHSVWLRYLQSWVHDSWWVKFFVLGGYLCNCRYHV